jgi:hypothetical protein
VRSREQRVQDTLEKLRCEVDVWIATANHGADPYLGPLPFYRTSEDNPVPPCTGQSCRRMPRRAQRPSEIVIRDLKSTIGRGRGCLQDFRSPLLG